MSWNVFKPIAAIETINSNTISATGPVDKYPAPTVGGVVSLESTPLTGVGSTFHSNNDTLQARQSDGPLSASSSAKMILRTGDFGLPSVMPISSTYKSALGYLLFLFPNLVNRILLVDKIYGSYLQVGPSMMGMASAGYGFYTYHIKNRSVVKQKFAKRRVTLEKSIAPIYMDDVYGEMLEVIKKCVSSDTSVDQAVKTSWLELAPIIASEVSSLKLMLSSSDFANILLTQYISMLETVCERFGITISGDHTSVTLDLSQNTGGEIYTTPYALIRAAAVYTVFKSRYNPASVEHGGGEFVSQEALDLSLMSESEDIQVNIIDGDDTITWYKGPLTPFLKDIEGDIDDDGKLTISDTLPSEVDPDAPLNIADGSPLVPDLTVLGEDITPIPSSEPIEVSEGSLPDCPGSCLAECGLVLKEIGAASQFSKVPDFSESAFTTAPSDEGRMSYEELDRLSKFSKDKSGIPTFSSKGIKLLIDRRVKMIRDYLLDLDLSTIPSQNAVGKRDVKIGNQLVSCVCITRLPEVVRGSHAYKVGADLYLKDVTNDLSGGLSASEPVGIWVPINSKIRADYLNGTLAFKPSFLYFSIDQQSYGVYKYTDYLRREYSHAKEAFSALMGLQPSPVEDKKSSKWLYIIAGALLLIILISIYKQQNKEKEKETTNPETINQG